MKIELSPIIIVLLATIPSLFVFLAMTLRQKSYNLEIKKLEDEIRDTNSAVLELEQEIVKRKLQCDFDFEDMQPMVKQLKQSRAI